MVGKTPRIRKQDRQRLNTIKDYCGCLPCLLMGHLDRHTTIEHITKAGRRVGIESAQHENTIGLCLWHHFQVCNNGQQIDRMVSEFVPSLAAGSRSFQWHFGDELRVLLPIQNYLLELFAEHPWPEYSVPRRVARDVRSEWITLNHANAQAPKRHRNRSS